MVFVCIVLAVILVFVLVRHLHFVWQIKSINEQIEFINTHETNKIVTGEYRNGSITDLINNINALSRQCSILKTQCLTNESNMKETITNISHDIRTPLTSIVGSASGILENQKVLTQEREMELVQDIKDEAQWLIRIVENLLSVTRINGENARINTEDEVVEEIISSAVIKFSKRFPEASVEVKMPEEFLMVAMDGVLIEQVLVNLLQNANTHTQGGQD